MLIIESAGLTDVGRKRKENQDCFLVDDRQRLYVVADGMGGHLAGEVAGRMVVDSIQGCFSAAESGPDDAITTIADEALSPEANRLLGAIHFANAQVFNASLAHAEYRGMGSTVAALLFAGDTFIAANVGDSPIYLIQAGRIERLSVPHTVLAEQQALAPDLAAASQDQFQHMLTRGMGVEPTVYPDICQSPCFNADRFILCSDGLSDKVTPQEMLELGRHGAPATICRRLCDLANTRGGDDNITVVCLAIKRPQGALGERLQRLYGTFQRMCGLSPKRTLCKGSKRCHS
jgi:serine/threonine protein phosphatase PrpC